MDVEVKRSVGHDLGAEVRTARAVAGGDTAMAYRLDLVDGRTVFAKTRPGDPPEVFATEAAGLRWLGRAATEGSGGREPADSERSVERLSNLSVPEVLAVGTDLAYLVLSWVETAPGRPDRSTDEDFGRALAGLHRAGAPSFGRSDRRPTGSRSLPNEPYPTWAEGYAANRLLPLARMAHDGDALPSGAVAELERVAANLGRFGAADEAPARLHGDLWAGNRLVDSNGGNWLIDPAAHGGHREFDLAMMRLFGGWSEAAFAAYDEEWPLAEGWRARVPLHQLAPLVIHAVKFGGPYPAATVEALAALR